MNDKIAIPFSSSDNFLIASRKCTHPPCAVHHRVIKIHVVLLCLNESVCFAAEDLTQSPTKKDSPTKTETAQPSVLNSNENYSPPATPTQLEEKVSSPSPVPSPLKTVELNGTATPDGKKSPSPEPAATSKQAINNDTKHVEELYDIPVGEYVTKLLSIACVLCNPNL